MNGTGARVRRADLESALADAGLPGTAVLAVAGRATVVCVPVPPGARPPALPAHVRALASCVVACMAADELAACADEALPAADPDRADFGGLAHVAPIGELEACVARAWEAVLGDAPVGRLDDLRACEGFSLMAVQVAHRLQSAIARPVAASDVRDACAVWDLARRLATRDATSTTEAPTPPRDDDHHRSGEPLPLSAAQRRIWLADSSAATPGLHHIALGWRVDGPLDEPALRSALDSLADRHDALRLRIANHAQGPRQVVHTRGTWPWRALDLAHAGDALDALRDEEARRPFDLDAAPPMRAALVRLGDGYVLLLTLHHLACDGWSVGLLCRELAAAYASARAGHVPTFGAAAGSYLAQVRKEAVAPPPTADAALAYWHDVLRPAPSPTALPLDRPRPPLADRTGAVLEIELGSALDASVRTLARQLGCTTFAVHAAALLLLLLRHGAEPDLCIGYTVANRPDPQAGDVVGCFIDALPLRTPLREDESFAALVGRVAQALARGDAHHDRPFDEVLKALPRSPGGGAEAPFSVLLNHNLNDTPPLDLAGARTRGLPRPGRGSPFDLVWNLFAREHALHLRLEYAVALFDVDTARGLARRYRHLLQEVARRPDAALAAIDVLDEDDARRLAAWSGRDVSPPAPGADVVARFESMAAALPWRCALRFEGRTVTYGELDARAAGLAARLCASGVGAGDPVAVCLARGIEGVVALLGILMAGGVYLPLDAGAPPMRQRDAIARSGVRALVADDASSAVAAVAPCPVVRVSDGLVTGAGVERPRVARPAQAPAYCIHTSGSTGEPKGVLVSHGALAEHVSACIDLHGVTAQDRLLQFASTAFDPAIEQTLTALCTGASLLVRGEHAWTLADFLAAMRDESVTVADVPTAWWQHLAVRDLLPGEAGPLRLLIVGGEPALVRDRLPAGWPRTLNAYGPTEATITATIDEIAAGDAHAGPFHPIGRALPGAQVHVLDDRLAPVPPGVVGELHIGGTRLALGYLGRPELTAERFVAAPSGAPGERLYRTGDRVRFLRDGRLEFIGRRDCQVKVRGFRVELGEIEHALARHPGIAAVAVVDLAGEHGDRRLVACAVPRDAALPADWRDWLRDRLPAYMVPTELRELVALPTGVGGKLDRKALAALASQAVAPSGVGEPMPAPSAAMDRLQQQLLALLPSAVFGPDDDLVDAGFHSLHLMRLSAFCRTEFGLELGLRDMLRARSLRRLAQRVADASAGVPAPPAPTRP